MLTLVRLLGVAALLAAPSLAGSSNHDSLRPNKRSHRQAANAARDVDLVARDLEERSNGTDTTLVKRDSFTGRGTYFYVGLGACGQWSKDSDYMVALNSAQYGGGYPGPQCFKQITIQANGQTVGGVTIMDECPTCDWGGLDLSPGLFQRFADLGAGVLDITWWFDGDSGPAPSSAAPSPPAPSSSTDEWWTYTSTDQWWTHTSTDQWWTHTSSSTPTFVAAAVSSTSSVAPSSSSAAPTSSSSSVAPTSSTNDFVIQASASAAVEVSVQIDAQANNLAGLSGLVASYGQLIVVGAGGHVAVH